MKVSVKEHFYVLGQNGTDQTDSVFKSELAQRLAEKLEAGITAEDVGGVLGNLQILAESSKIFDGTEGPRKDLSKKVLKVLRIF